MKHSRFTYYLLIFFLCAGVFFLSYISTGISFLSQLTILTCAEESELEEPEIECNDLSSLVEEELTYISDIYLNS